jgi:O-acetylhomoserine (thiol)-lyase
VVDNTFATPYLCRPLEWGADVVLHSATKFLGGHGTSIGGIVVDSGRFPWDNGRFPNLTEPSPAYHGLQFDEAFGPYGFLTKLRAESLRDLGACLSPFNAFLFLLGVETLHVRMERHVRNALEVASYLQRHPLVETVRYPGLPDSPYAALVQKYLPRGAGAVFTFDVRGGRAVAQRFVESLDLFSHLANVGDAKSLVIHPGSTTHRQLSEQELLAMGIGSGTIRVSIGLETAEDLIRDLEHALDAARAELEVGTAR